MIDCWSPLRPKVFLPYATPEQRGEDQTQKRTNMSGERNISDLAECGAHFLLRYRMLAIQAIMTNDDDDTSLTRSIKQSPYHVWNHTENAAAAATLTWDESYRVDEYVNWNLYSGFGRHYIVVTLGIFVLAVVVMVPPRIAFCDHHLLLCHFAVR